MKITVWRSGHEIADTIAEAVYEGLKLPARYGKCTVDKFTTEMGYDPNVIETPDVHIGYGILRGMSEVYHAAEQANKPWFNIDKGYWKPGHYDGYYRVSLRGTQQTTGLDKLKPDYERWDALGLEVLPPKERDSGGMICPPTDYVKQFFNLPHNYYVPHDAKYNEHGLIRCFIRNKDSKEDLQNDLDRSEWVATFNSSVGWEALRQGIPVMSDPTHSILGAYDKLMDNGWQSSYEERRKFFSIQCSLQRTLTEIKSGELWPLLQNLMKIS